MEKSTNRELWIGFRHPNNGTVSVQWFAADGEHSAKQKAEAFLKGPLCKEGKIIAGAKTPEQAIDGYNEIMKGEK